MKQIRLFINDTIHCEKLIALDKEQTHYLKNVMRLTIGQQVNIFNGTDGQWNSIIEGILKHKIIIKAIKNTQKQYYTPEVCLCFPLAKWSTLSSVIRQATELGVTQLQPVITDYTTVRKITLRKIEICAIEAAEQCERLTIPKISDVLTFDKACKEYKDNLVICDETTQGQSPQKIFSNMVNATILIGPEGGFSSNELEYQNLARITLGTEILRIDTAIVSALTYFKAFSLQE